MSPSLERVPSYFGMMVLRCNSIKCRECVVESCCLIGSLDRKFTLLWAQKHLKPTKNRLQAIMFSAHKQSSRETSIDLAALSSPDFDDVFHQVIEFLTTLKLLDEICRHQGRF